MCFKKAVFQVDKVCPSRLSFRSFNCFLSLLSFDILKAKPGPAHIWTSLQSGTNQTTEQCSKTWGSSWLLHKYNRFNREKWGLIPTSNTGVQSVAPSTSSVSALDISKPSITLVMRKGSNMRVFANEDEVVKAISDIPGAGVVRAVDFSAIPFSEQIELVHSTRSKDHRPHHFLPPNFFFLNLTPRCFEMVRFFQL